MTFKLHGLVAATHTPFDADGRLNLAAVERQAEHLLRNAVKTVFIGGTTGESHSLTVEERLSLARRWSDVIRSSSMRLVVHVGSNCLADARTLAAQAQELRVAAIATLSPSYFKPKSLDALVACYLQSGPVPAAAAQRKEFAGHGIFVARQASSLRGPLPVQTPPTATRFKWLVNFSLRSWYSLGQYLTPSVHPFLEPYD